MYTILQKSRLLDLYVEFRIQHKVNWTYDEFIKLYKYKRYYISFEIVEKRNYLEETKKDKPYLDKKYNLESHPCFYSLKIIPKKLLSLKVKYIKLIIDNKSINIKKSHHV